VYKAKSTVEGLCKCANSDCECNRKLHEDRYGSSQCRHRNAILQHLTYRSRIVPQLSPAEDQKQRREKNTRHENDLIVDVVYHNDAVVPCFLVTATVNQQTL